VVGVGALAVHAEEYRPGGEVLHGDSPDIAVRCAEVFARLMAELARRDRRAATAESALGALGPYRFWGVWPAIDFLDSRDQGVVSEHIVETAEPVTAPVLAVVGERVCGVWCRVGWRSDRVLPERAAMGGSGLGAVDGVERR
jgi:hypothetical protein